MPTQKFEPEVIPPGYEKDRSFTEEQISQFGEILDKSPGEIAVVLQNAARAIWMYEYTQPASDSEIVTGLSNAAQHADQLRARIAELGPASKGVLLSEYGRSKRLARTQFKKDAAALDRLCFNLITATKRAKPRRGRPPNKMAEEAAHRLMKAYTEISGVRMFNSSRRNNAARRFVLAGLRMLGIAPRTASGAFQRVIEANAERQKLAKKTG